MRRLELHEHERYEGAELSPEQASSLQALVPDLKINPARSGVGYDLETGSHVGALRIGELAVEIRPKIELRELLFVLTYSLTPDTWREFNFDYRRYEGYVEPLAFGFVRFCRQALSRGLLRGYRERSEVLQSVRGRIRFDAQIKKRFGRVPPVELQFDEFTEDVSENRVLFAAVEALGRLHLRSRRLRMALRSLRPAFTNVSLVDYPRQPLPEISFTRLNEHYRPAIRLARLILDGVSIRHRTGDVTNASFLLDMNQLFEDFVVVALREALGLTERSFPQEAKRRSLSLDVDRRVSLAPDLSWWRDGRCVFVGDVKYKRRGESGGKNSDLYQLLAYLVATGLPSGMLIYAEGDEHVTRHTVREIGKELQVLTLDLTNRPAELLGEVDELADEIRGSVNSLVGI